MGDSKRRKMMIKERQRQTGEPFMAASRGLGTWWAENRPGQGPRKEPSNVPAPDTEDAPAT